MTRQMIERECQEVLAEVGGSTSMTINAGVGMSHHHNPNAAGREAAEQALEKAGVTKPDFVFMFASIGYDQRCPVQSVFASDTSVTPTLDRFLGP
jgi:hypothetical protein